MASDWTTIAAVALAVVLVHSAWQHLAASPGLEAHYRARLGDSGWAHVVGAGQLALALGLVVRRTRISACAMLIAVVVAALFWQVFAGTPAENASASALIVIVALAIAIGESRRHRRAVTQAEYSRPPDG